MQLKSGLVIVLVLSAVLAGTLAEKRRARRKRPSGPTLKPKEKLITDDGTLMPHVKEEDLLSEQQLAEQFEQLNYDRGGKPDPERVMRILYKAKDKASMKPAPEVIVEELIAQNSFKDLSECGVMNFKKRVEIMDRMLEDHGQIYETISTGLIHSYLSSLLMSAAKKCVEEENFKEVISKGYNSKEWLDGLRKAIEQDENLTFDSWEESDSVLSISEICPYVLSFVKDDPKLSHDATLEPTLNSTPAEHGSAKEHSSSSVAEWIK